MGQNARFFFFKRDICLFSPCFQSWQVGQLGDRIYPMGNGPSECNQPWDVGDPMELTQFV